jgi:4-hydroxybenzoate polyprenyltransferase
MNQLNLFVELTRLKKPIGYMLLFWPCAWGLTLVYNFSESLDKYFFYLILFFLGAILMRSAGCIVNDILDRKFDKKVSRTKNRPIASGKISVHLGFFYAITLCFFAFLVLINFNYFTIIMALGSMPLAFTYPLMKRYTYWPQLFLGITFNYGLILGWTSISGQLDMIPIIFYFGAIFWTLGYDTIYGFQDIKDDEIIGLKSTSIKFKGTAKLFLILCYLILIISLALGGYFMGFNLFYFLFLIIPLIHLFFYQIKIFNIKKPSTCLRIFKSNNYLGFIILINIFIGKTL